MLHNTDGRNKEKIQINGENNCVHGLEDSTQQRRQFFPSWYTDWMLCLSISAVFFVDIDKIITKLTWKDKGTRVAEVIWKRRIKESVYLILRLIKKCVAQSCLILCDPVDYSPPGSSVRGILQARTLEWVAIPSSKGSSHPRNQTRVSCIAGRFFSAWAKTD